MEATKDDCPFECNICLTAPVEPVVTPCGHLYWYISPTTSFAT